ncbi:MAG: ImmA/IrrE family metallo-endopeptidase [Rudaea sp.]|uniref:ImmA/IrrE family metallo-endopeptidase n=1 Tax=unclassified Rudaea TaxID=2627037 RepID=UPI0010F71313|nr:MULTISPECIES: ImmA/IrrE family metallo-endopeptidase [unclassified Rudaea]MBN8886833.1 ImmA/IrrE family metallo-endopeptidase [Rudaea sp.]
MADELTASKAAYRFTRILNLFAEYHGTPRFPIDIVALAKDAANQFHWSDPITKVQAESIKNFEGALIPSEGRRDWLLLYNSNLKSEGRIRFTQAHELGHYLLHRHQRDSFSCTEGDLINLETDDATIEAQADSFASTLLMPLDDFRGQMNGSADFDCLGACAARYGVSLTATTLRWLKHTEHHAILVVHRDGYMNWAFSSGPALKSGAFFKTRNQTIAIPNDTLAADMGVSHERTGVEIAARKWFPHAPADFSLREMKITSNEYDAVMSLLVLPKGEKVWKPKDE